MLRHNCMNFERLCNEKVERTLYKDLKNKLKKNQFPHFTKNEVVIHNSPNDCWVSFLGVVRNLSPLILRFIGSSAIKPILAFAGKDISDWFDPRSGDILYHVHPVTGVRVPFTPHGLIPDVWTVIPTSAWEPIDDIPWWFDPSLVVGFLSKNARPIRIMNVLTGTETTIEVCSEDTLERILERVLMINSHARSYTWRYESRVLDMELTLDDNRIPDLRPQFRAANLPDNIFVPCLMLYFNDDLS